MRYALIDNSTLTGIQRLLGEIPVKNKNIIDNDILTFENYIQSILFYDELICIDDYKPKYQHLRKNYFSDIKFISKDIFDYQNFINQSNEITKNIILRIEGGKITDSDFKRYFEQLKMTFQFTWDMSASKFFLTQKMLLGNTDLDKGTFSKLHALLFKENNEQYEVNQHLNNKMPILYDSDGNKIELDPDSGKITNKFGQEGLSSKFQALVASLNWISQRTAFYVLVADYLHADLFIQPIRQAFLNNIIKKIYPKYNLGTFTNFRNNINRKMTDSLSNILENQLEFGLSFKIPLFSASFASNTKDPKEIIEIAYNERDNKSFFYARQKLRELNQILEDDNRAKFIREINLLTSDLNQSFQKIEKKYGIGEKQGFGLTDLNFIFGMLPISKNIKIPDVLDFRIKGLEFLKHSTPKKGFKLVYRNLADDLMKFDNLGKYKDILTSKVNFHENATSWDIGTEDPKYIRASSYWKKPM